MSSLPIDTRYQTETDHPDITENVLSFYCQESIKEQSIPMDVIRIIKLFWSIGKIWSVDQYTLSGLYTKTNHKKKYKLSSINAHGAIFECNLFRDTSCLFYELCAVSIPIYIKKIRIYFELSCSSTKIKYQNVKLLFKKDTGYYSKKWRSEQLQILEYDSLCEYQHMQFQCVLDVLQIKYIKQSNPNFVICNDKYLDFFKPVSLKKHVEYLFDKRSSTDCGFEKGQRIFSEPFGGGSGVENVGDHCYWLEIRVMSTAIKINLKLFQLPEKMIEHKLDFEYSIKSDKGYNQQHLSGVRHGIVLTQQVTLGTLHNLRQNKFFAIDRIKFKLEINIINSCWSKYINS